MVAPVGVDHADFGQRRVTVFAAEVCLTERQILRVHRQPVTGHESRQRLPAQRGKPGQRLHRFRRGVGLFQRRLFGQPGLAAFHGVDHVFFHALQLVRRGRAKQQVYPRRAHRGAFPAAHQLHALLARGGAHVKLARQRLHREHRRRVGLRQNGIMLVQLRLKKNDGQALREKRLVHPFDIVAVQQPHAGNAL